MTKSFIRSSAALAIADFSRKALLAITVLICARLVSKETFGNYMFVMSFYQVFSVVAGAGIPSILVRQVASDRYWVPDRVLGSVLVRTVFALPAVALMMGCIFVGRFSLTFLPAIGVLAFLVITRAITENAVAIFQGREEMIICAATSFVQSAVTLVSTVLVCIFSKQLLPLVACHLLGAICSSLFALFMFLRSRVAVLSSVSSSLKMARDLLLETGWMNGAALISSAYNRCDVLLLERLASAEAVAIYSAPYRVLDIAQIIPQGVMGVVLARLSAGSRQNANTVDQGLVIFVLLIASALLIALTSLAAPLLVPLLLGRAYTNSVFVVQILVWATPLMFWNGVANVNFIAHKVERYVFYGCAGALAFNIIANLAFIHRYSYLASAFITVVTEGLLFVLNLYFSKRARLSFRCIHPVRLSVVMVIAVAGSFLCALSLGGRSILGMSILCLAAFLSIFELQRLSRSANIRSTTQGTSISL